MDFARIDPRRDAENGATYHVEFEGQKLTHEGKPITIKFQGTEGKVGKRAAAKMVKAIDAKSGRKRDVSKMDVSDILEAAEQHEEERARFYAELTMGWDNIFYLEDEQIDDPDAVPEPLSFSQDNAFKLFSTRPWIMEGIDGFLADKLNFIRGGVTG